MSGETLVLEAVEGCRPYGQRHFGLIWPWAEAALGLLGRIGFGTSMVLAEGALLTLNLAFGSNVSQDGDAVDIQLI
jgi:hypothetical protein